MTPASLTFLRLHQRHFVESWHAIFQGAMVRARTDRGVTATVALHELECLVDAGLLRPSWGGSFVLTDEGARV